MVKDQTYLEQKTYYCLDYAKKLGATNASVVVSNSISETVNFRNKKLEESNRSDNLGINITTYIGKKKSSISSSNLLKDNLNILIEKCIETTKAETALDGAVTPHFSMNSVAMQCNGGFVKTDGAATVADIESIVKEGVNNLYASTSGGGTYVNTLSGPVNGSAESAATVTVIPEKYNADNFFDTTDYIGAVKGATDTWYKNWTLSGTIDVQ